jgi:hypothetical protein
MVDTVHRVQREKDTPPKYPNQRQQALTKRGDHRRGARTAADLEATGRPER